MRWKTPALSALCLSLGACSSTPPSMPPTAPPIQPPTACLQPCPPLPRLDSRDEGALGVWLHDLIDTAGQCRRLHDACRGFHAQSRP